jgi:hypothetical protein
MDYSSLAGIHFAKEKRRSACANPVRRKIGHRTQLCFPGRAKPFNVAHDPLTIGKTPTKRLSYQMLYGLEELATLDLQQTRIGAA